MKEITMVVKVEQRRDDCNDFMKMYEETKSSMISMRRVICKKIEMS